MPLQPRIVLTGKRLLSLLESLLSWCAIGAALCDMSAGIAFSILWPNPSVKRDRGAGVRFPWGALVLVFGSMGSDKGVLLCPFKLQSLHLTILFPELTQ